MPLSPSSRRIVAWLREHLREGPHSPRDIARGTGMNRSTVRKELTRLLQREDGPALVQVQPGYYRAFLDAGELARFQAPLPAVHHVHLHVPLPQNGVTGLGPRARQATLDAASLGGVQVRYVPENGGEVWEDYFEGRRVAVTLYNTARLAVLQLRASEAPLDAPTWQRFLAWVRGVFLGWGVNVEQVPAVVAQFDVGVDLHGLRIEGASSVSLRRFSDAFLRAYNKADRLRFEVASAHPCTPTEITRILEHFSDRSTTAPGAPAAAALAPATPPAPWGMEVV